ncbi:hypothetical protein PQX77_019194, partial [Marasmius sp. AFHP31]
IAMRMETSTCSLKNPMLTRTRKTQTTVWNLICPPVRSRCRLLRPHRSRGCLEVAYGTYTAPALYEVTKEFTVNKHGVN